VTFRSPHTRPNLSLCSAAPFVAKPSASFHPVQVHTFTVSVQMCRRASGFMKQSSRWQSGPVREVPGLLSLFRPIISRYKGLRRYTPIPKRGYNVAVRGCLISMHISFAQFRELTALPRYPQAMFAKGPFALQTPQRP